MNSIINLKPAPINSPSLILNPKKSAELGLDKKKYGYVCFGKSKYFVEIKKSKELKNNDVLISTEVMNSMYIPEYLTYEIRTDKSQISLGPCIGIIIGKENRKITEQSLNCFLSYTSKYNLINGAIILFTLDRINKYTQLIEGYCYNPKTNTWEKGVFPYPSSIYTKIALNDEWRNHLASTIDCNFFNDKNIDRWEMINVLSSDNEIKHSLPYTVLYESYFDIFDFMKKYNRMFICSTLNIRNKDVIEVVQDNRGIVFKHCSQGSNEVIINNTIEVEELASTKLKPRKYIIQQPVETIKVDDCISSIRVIMQKESFKKWICSGMFGRYGNESEIINGGWCSIKVTPSDFLLKNKLLISDTEIDIIKQQIASLCQRICTLIDESGLNFGSLELDICISQSRKLSVVNINSFNTDFKIALESKSTTLYSQMKSNLLLYAKSLAGF